MSSLQYPQGLNQPDAQSEFIARTPWWLNKGRKETNHGKTYGMHCSELLTLTSALLDLSGDRATSAALRPLSAT